MAERNLLLKRDSENYPLLGSQLLCTVREHSANTAPCIVGLPCQHCLNMCTQSPRNLTPTRRQGSNREHLELGGAQSPRSQTPTRRPSSPKRRSDTPTLRADLAEDSTSAASGGRYPSPVPGRSRSSVSEVGPATPTRPPDDSFPFFATQTLSRISSKDRLAPADDDEVGGSYDGETSSIMGFSLATNVDEQDPDNYTRFVSFAASLIANTTVMLPLPFFQNYASDRFGASDSAIGFTIACNPIAQIMTTPIWAMCMPRYGRRWCLIAGLILLSVGSVCFALGDGMHTFMIARVLQGTGFQGTLVAGVALLMESSDDLERDMGYQEIMVGLGFMFGPTFGATMFQLAGFTWAVLPSALTACAMAVVAIWLLQPWVVPAVEPERPAFVPLPTLVEGAQCLYDEMGQTMAEIARRESDLQRERSESYLSIEWERERRESELQLLQQEESKKKVMEWPWGKKRRRRPDREHSFFWGCFGLYAFLKWIKRTIGQKSEDVHKYEGASVKDVFLGRTSMGVFACLAVMAASQSFLDMVLGRHVLLMSSSDQSPAAGTAFAIMPFVYSVACYYVGRLSQVSNHTLFATGMLMYALGYYFLSPPFMFVHATSIHVRPVLEVEAPSIPNNSTMPTVELPPFAEWMIDAMGLTICGIGASFVLVPSVPLMRDGFERGGGEGDPTDAISSVYTAAWSLGELIGPPMGGLLLDIVPKRQELNCFTPGKWCTWGYFWSTSLYAGLLGSFGALFIILVPWYGKEEDDMDSDEADTVESQGTSTGARV